MKWSKQLIPSDKQQLTIDALIAAVKSGDEKLEKIRCVFLIDNLLYVLMPWDFLDIINAGIEIKELHIYQVLEN